MMKKRVACIGDSLTWGFSLPDPRRQSYPALLQERLGEDYVVRNFGCNGASVRCDADLPYVQTLAYGESRAWNQNIVLLMLGSNDATPWDWDAAAFRSDYERIVASYRELPFTLPKGNQVVSGSMDLVWETAEGCVLVDYKNYPGYDNVMDAASDFYAGKYAPQLKAYAEALQAAGKKVRDSLIYYAVRGVAVRIVQ